MPGGSCVRVGPAASEDSAMCGRSAGSLDPVEGIGSAVCTVAVDADDAGSEGRSSVLTA